MKILTGYKINQVEAIGYKFEGEEEENIYYIFEVKKTDSSAIEYYFVKRDTGEIFIGKFDEKRPDLIAVPESLAE